MAPTEIPSVKNRGNHDDTVIIPAMRTSACQNTADVLFADIDFESPMPSALARHQHSYCW
jgi:hypothetical protein